MLRKFLVWNKQLTQRLSLTLDWESVLIGTWINQHFWCRKNSNAQVGLDYWKCCSQGPLFSCIFNNSGNNSVSWKAQRLVLPNVHVCQNGICGLVLAPGLTPWAPNSKVRCSCQDLKLCQSNNIKYRNMYRFLILEYSITRVFVKFSFQNSYLSQNYLNFFWEFVTFSLWGCEAH